MLNKQFWLKILIQNLTLTCTDGPLAHYKMLWLYVCARWTWKDFLTTFPLLRLARTTCCIKQMGLENELSKARCSAFMVLGMTLTECHRFWWGCSQHRISLSPSQWHLLPALCPDELALPQLKSVPYCASACMNMHTKCKIKYYIVHKIIT